MNWKSVPVALLMSVAFGLAGCRMLTEPVRNVFHSPEPAAPNTDVTNPGRPLPAPSPTPRTASRKSTSGSTSATSKPVAASKTIPSAQFPVAKPVPGKPGLVFNPFKPNGGYIDVSGYAPGSKVKDPETQKIFVVP